MFIQIAAGIDDRTWEYHLRRAEFSKWFREAIKDEDLAAEAARVEADRSLRTAESRDRIMQMIERRYTAPASSNRTRN